MRGRERAVMREIENKEQRTMTNDRRMERTQGKEKCEDR